MVAWIIFCVVCYTNLFPSIIYQIAGFDDVKFETACTLSQLYSKIVSFQFTVLKRFLCIFPFCFLYVWVNGFHFQNRPLDAQQLLRNAVEISQQSPFWHCRLLFQLSVGASNNHNFAFLILQIENILQGRRTFLCVDILPLKVVPFCNLQQLFAYERDYVSACHYLSLGIEHTGQKRADYTRILFMLSKGMIGFAYYHITIWNYAVIFIRF